MALTDPQTITIDGVAISLALVQNQGTSSLYQSADNLDALRVSWNKQNGKVRYLISFRESAIASDPISAANKSVTTTINLTIDQPDFGITDARVVKIIAGLKTLLSTSAAGFVERVLAGEH